MNLDRLHALFLESTGVSTDTRSVQDGRLFFALKGPNFNGNLFAGQALDAGAAYVVVDEDAGTPDDRTIQVDNTLNALQDLARHHRLQFDIPVIGITGSNGKTTNKELIYAALSRKYETLCTKGNLNNHIGVPLTLLDLQDSHEMAIVEIGANHVGEIAELCDIARPGFGLITSIGLAHLEGFGSVEGIKRGKKELYDFVTGTGGKCFVNLAQEVVPELFEGEAAQAVYFGNEDYPPFTLSIEQQPFLEAAFRTSTNDLTIRSRLIGSFQADNLLHALAIAQYFDVPETDIVEALEAYKPSNNRAELTEYNGNRIILDAYNANPSSMEAAIAAFAASEGGPKMLILGDMFELGKDSLAYHQAIVDQADDASFDTVVLVGKDFARTKRPLRMYHFDTTAEVKEWWQDQAVEGYSILIKGSRGVHLEVLLRD